MIQLSTTVAQIAASQNIKYFFLVTLKGTDNYTTAPYDLTMDNGITYISDGGLQDVEPPRISSTVDRSNYKISFADVNFAFKSYFEEGATGDTIEVRVGFYNTLSDTTESIEVGKPFTQMSNTVVVYKGVIDSQSYAVDIENSEVVAIIEGSSPMADLDLVRARFTNKDSVQQFNPNDTAFDKVFEGSGQIKLKWGKA
jgi:hypothetical protein